MNDIKIKRAMLGLLQTNSYLIFGKDDEVIAVDPATSKIIDLINAEQKKCVAVLLTHAHFDHIGGAYELQKLGAKVYVHKDDEELLMNPKSQNFDMIASSVKGVRPDVLIEDNQTLTISGIDIKVIATPGHTKGSVCYLVGDYIFSGDTLFNCSIGNTSEDSLKEEIDSIKNKLYKLSNKTVFCGHGEDTDIDFEKDNNPWTT